MQSTDVRIKFRIWAAIVKVAVLGSCLLPDRLTAQIYHNFLVTVLPGQLEDLLLAVSCDLSSTELQFTMEKTSGCDISRREDRTSRADCMAFSIPGSKPGGSFTIGTSEGARS